LDVIDHGDEPWVSRYSVEPLLDDRRLVSRMLRHWNELAPNQGFPSRGQVDPFLVGDDWANCMLIGLRPQMQKSTFVIVGGNLLPSPGRALEGRWIADCPSDTLLGMTLSRLADVLAERAPLVLRGAALHLGTPVLFRSVLLPLAEDGTQIDTVFGAANYRQVEALPQPLRGG
jgi:hypothetical protein